MCNSRIRCRIPRSKSYHSARRSSPPTRSTRHSGPRTAPHLTGAPTCKAQSTELATERQRGARTSSVGVTAPAWAPDSEWVSGRLMEAMTAKRWEPRSAPRWAPRLALPLGARLAEDSAARSGQTWTAVASALRMSAETAEGLAIDSEQASASQSAVELVPSSVEGSELRWADLRCKTGREVACAALRV